jgi:SAM-dependent methyltransferase
METSSTAQVRGTYDGWAESHARLMDAEIELPVYADVLGRLAARLADLSGPVIDTSCGSGHMLARYHHRYDPHRALIGIDLSPAMVALAVAKLGPAAQIRVGDMRQPSGLTTETAAAVISFFALYHLTADLVACRYREEQICHGVRAAGLIVDRAAVEPVEEMPMDALYVEASRPT